jgi:2-dehydropantoate 2-reductase
MIKHFAADHCLAGSGSIGTKLDGPGACTSFPNEGIIVNFGALQKSELAEKAGRYLEDCFQAGGCNAKYRDDILPMIWWKVIKNCSHSPVCATLRLSVGAADADPNGRELFDRVIREGVAIAKAKGVNIMDADAFIAHDKDQCKENGTYVNSMTQDVVWKKLPTEVDMLTGALSEYGKELGVPTPTCDILNLIIRAIQANYDNQVKELSC